MQPRNARLEACAEDRRAFRARDIIQELRCKNADAREIDAIAGAQNDMVESSGTVVEIDDDAIGICVSS